MLRPGLERIPGTGPLAVSVPGAVMAWWDLHQRFGKLEWARLFDSAIYYAEAGHPVAQVRPQINQSGKHSLGANDRRWKE